MLIWMLVKPLSLWLEWATCGGITATSPSRYANVQSSNTSTARAVNQLQTVMLVPGNGIGQKMLAGIENLVHRGGSFREYGTHGRTDGNGRENRL